MKASAITGVDWMDRVNKLAFYLQPNGGVIEIDDILQGNALTPGNIPSNVTLEFTGRGNFGLKQMQIGAFTKIYGRGAQLTALLPNTATVLNTTGSALQTNDRLVIEGLRFSGMNIPGSCGISTGTAKAVLNNLEMTGFQDCALKFVGAQFASTRKINLWGNYVGLKNYATVAGGGGNSNKFRDWVVVGNVVGAIFADQGSPWGMGANVFDESDFLSNACAVAMFGNNWRNVLSFVGGCPEHNDPSGAPAASFPLVIDDNVIPQQTAFYLSNARILFDRVSIGDASVSPWTLAQKNSRVVLRDVGGYGNPTGDVVLCDPSSSVECSGGLGVIGVLNNVITLPETLDGQWVKLLAAPQVQGNPMVPNAAGPMTLSDTLGANSSRVNDPVYGAVYAVTFAKIAGSQDNNRFLFSLGNIPMISDVRYEMLLKSDVDCVLGVGHYGDNTSQAAPIRLPAGQWRKLIVLLQNVPVGNKRLIGFPRDTTGATVQIGSLRMGVAPSGSLAARQLTT